MSLRGKSDRSPEVGQVWRTHDRSENWLITAENPDGRGAYNVTLLDDDRLTNTTDALWGAEIPQCAEFVEQLHPCEGDCGDWVGGPADEFPYCARCLLARMSVWA